LLLRKNPALKKQQLSNIKAHLYKQLLTSLRLLENEKDIDIQLHEQLDYARILYNKGLYLQSLKLLEKIKETARAHNQVSMLVQVIFLEKGAGALRSTLADMSKFADALLAGTKGPLGHVWPLLAGGHADMPGVGGRIGLGLIQAKDNGEDAYLHDGGTGGFRSTLLVRPGSGRAVVVLASNAAAEPQALLSAWQATGREPAKRSEITLPAEALDEYPGVYAIDPSSRFTLLRRGDGLIARLTGQPFFPLFASAKDEFFYKIADAQLSFHRDESGKIKGLTLHQNGRDIPASRQDGPPTHIEFPDAARLAEYAGEYDFGQFEPGATLTVRVLDETLTVMLTGQPSLPVFATGKDRFESDAVEASVTFERDAAGKVVALVLHQNGMDMRSPRR
jgi:hypothetical protein